MALIAGTAGAVSAVSAGADALGVDLGLGSVISGIGGFLGIGNNRDEKRAKRKKIKQALYNAGVNRTFASNTHSDNWNQLAKVAEFVEKNGKPAIAYINDKFGNRSRFGSKKGGVVPSQVTRGYQRWLEDQQADDLANKTSEAAQKATKAAGSSPFAMVAILAVVAGLIFYGGK